MTYLLSALLWFGISATDQEAISAELETDQPTLESLLPPLDFDFYGRIAVLPPKNLGDEQHDWISIAIQDALTQDLWQVEAFEARSLRTFSGKFIEHCSGLELRCVTQSDAEVLTTAVNDQYLRYAITGEYRFDDDQVTLSLQWLSMSATADELPGPERIELTTNLSTLTDTLSESLAGWLKVREIKLPTDRIGRMMRQKSDKPLSLQYAADAYWLQQQFQLDREDSQIIDLWADAVERAVKTDRHHPQAWTLLGWHRFNTAQTAAASEAFTQAIELNDVQIDAFTGLVFSQDNTPAGQQLRADYAVRAANLNRGISPHQYNARLHLLAINELQKALQYSLTVSSLSLDIYGPNDIRLANANYNSAAVYQNLNNYHTAISMYQVALRIFVANLGEQHGSVADTRNNMGAVYWRLAEYSKALEQYELALDTNIAILGEQHTNVADIRNNIGIVYRDLADHPKALAQYEAALAIKISQLGEQHTSVARTRNNIGVVYQDLADYPKALEQYKLALITYVAAQGEQHINVAETRTNIGSVYHDLDDYTKSLEQYELALAIYVLLDDQHPSVAHTRLNMGLVFKDLADYPKALEQYELALTIYIALHGEQHPSVAATRNNIGVVYQLLADYPNALKQLMRARDTKIKLFGEQHTNLANTRLNIGLVFRNLGDYPKALEEYKLALATRIAVFGDKHTSVADIRVNMGVIYYKLANNPNALELFELAQATYIATLGEQHTKVALTRRNLSLVWEELTNAQLAISYAIQSVNAIQKTRQSIKQLDSDLQDSFQENYREYYQHLADLLLQQGRIGDAERVLDMLKDTEQTLSLIVPPLFPVHAYPKIPML